MSRDTDDQHSITRRDLMGSAGTAASTGLLSKYISDPAQAQTQTNTEPRMQFGSDWEFIEVSDGSGGVNLRIRHIPSGEMFTMQSDGTTSTRALDTEELSNVYDYIVSPDDDIADIINNQLSTGESVWVGLGTHIPDTSGGFILDVTADDATIDGLGTIKVPDDAPVSGSVTYDDAVVAISADNVVLDGFTIDGNRANQFPADSTERIVGIKPNDASDYEIRNVEVKESTGVCIGNSATTGSGGEIINCWLHDGDKGGTHDCTPETIGRGNRIENLPNQDGIEPLGDRQTWTNNIVKNCAGGAFDVVSARGVTVADNLIIQGENGPAHGIIFQDAGTGDLATSCTATGNIHLGHDVMGVSNSSERIFGVDGQQDCQFVGNVALGTHSPIILRESDIKFAENTIAGKRGSGMGVKIEASGATVKDNRFVDNSGAFDIEVVDGLSEITIAENEADNSASQFTRINGGTNHKISGNEITGCSADGIYLDGCSKTQVSQNVLIDCGSGISDAGVRVNDPDSVKLDNNKYKNIDDRGILVKATDGNSHTGVIITGEQAVGPGSSSGIGIEIAEGSGTLDDVRLSGNDIRTTSWYLPYDITVSGTLFRNGTEFLSGSPTAGDYIAAHTGNKVIDQSTSPSDVYYVDGAGSLDGPV